MQTEVKEEKHPMEAQRVMVIQDASKEVSWNAIKWPLHGLSLQPGDSITFLSVLHQVINPSTSSCIPSRKSMGYKCKADSSIFGLNQKIIDQEVDKKNNEYQNNEELTEIDKKYQMNKVEFKIEVNAGPSPKVVVEAARRLRPTWLVLDRHMKKDQKYFLEKFPCGISRLRRDNRIEKLRGPKAIKKSQMQMAYSDMTPGSNQSDDLFSIEHCTTFNSSLGSSGTSSSCLTDEKCTPHDQIEDNTKIEDTTKLQDQIEDTTKTKTKISADVEVFEATPKEYEIETTEVRVEVPDGKPSILHEIDESKDPKTESLVDVKVSDDTPNKYEIETTEANGEVPDQKPTTPPEIDEGTTPRTEIFFDVEDLDATPNKYQIETIEILGNVLDQQPTTPRETESSRMPEKGISANMKVLDATRDKYDIETIEANGEAPDQITANSSNTKHWMAPIKTEESYDISFVCTICNNRGTNKSGTKNFTYAELQAATNRFSPENILFEGGYGTVFKGQLKNTLKVAIKDHRDSGLPGKRKFSIEVQTLGKTSHKNVVTLLGSCTEGSHRFLVYEYVCYGALDHHLRNSRPLPWSPRMKIALGVSQGLNYLHANKIIHRDITPNNILVTHDYVPQLGGFGFALPQCNSSQALEPRAIGTFGYLAPEYAETGIASYKTDVYSFGVVLLELIMGRTYKDGRLEGKSLLQWAKPLLKQKKYAELVDTRILDSHDTQQFNWTVQLAEKCLTKDPQNRPNMDMVVSALEHIKDGKAPWSLDKV